MPEPRANPKSLAKPLLLAMVIRAMGTEEKLRMKDYGAYLTAWFLTSLLPANLGVPFAWLVLIATATTYGKEAFGTLGDVAAEPGLAEGPGELQTAKVAHPEWRQGKKEAKGDEPKGAAKNTAPDMTGGTSSRAEELRREKYLAKVYAEVKRKFPRVANSGICRVCSLGLNAVAGAGWSQHNYCSALDIDVPNVSSSSPRTAYGDKVYAWLVDNKQRLGLEDILWRVPNHYDHIHIDLAPHLTGTPARCA